LTFRNEIVWDKANASGLYDGNGIGSSIGRQFANISERCLFYIVGEQGFNNNADNYFEGWDSIVDYLDTEKNKAKLTIKDCKRLAGHSEKSGCHWFDKSQWMMPTEETYNSWRDYCQQNNIDAFKKEYDELKKEYDELKKEWYSTRAYFDNTHENMTDVWEYPRVQGEERWGHATPKPVDMIARIYKSSSPDDGIIYSPFLGSGTDIIAGEKSGGDRTVCGFELSPAYCEIICQRFSKLTGIEPKLIGKLPD
jgi:DNA modification methylase